jgi:hypothetical protein
MRHLSIRIMIHDHGSEIPWMHGLPLLRGELQHLPLNLATEVPRDATLWLWLPPGLHPRHSGGAGRHGGGAAVSGDRWWGGVSVAGAGERSVPPRDTVGPIVGRQHEVDSLEGWFQPAATGNRQLVFFSGEVGIGKTTVLDLWLRRCATEHQVRMARGQCVEHVGEGEAYLPLLGALGRLARGTHAASISTALIARGRFRP